MKPLREMDAATLCDARGVIFDIDDTVTRDGRLEAASFDALWRLANAGVVLVPITGRPLGWVDVIARHWPVTLAAGENGAGWVAVTKDGVREGYFDDDNTRAKQHELVSKVQAAVLSAMPHIHLSADTRARRCDLAFDIGELFQVPEGEVAKIVAIIEGHGARATTSTVHCHVVPGAWDKAKGATAAIRDILGVDIADTAERQRWFFIGDSPNDTEAFAHFPNSVGVANVKKHIGKMTSAPRYVTDGVHGVGFAELADRILGART